MNPTLFAMLAGMNGARVTLSDLALGVNVNTTGSPFLIIIDPTDAPCDVEATFSLAVWHATAGGGGVANATPFLLTSWDDGLTWAVAAQGTIEVPGDALYEVIPCSAIGPYVAVAWVLNGTPNPTATGKAMLIANVGFKAQSVNGLVTVDTTYATPSSSVVYATQAWVLSQIEALSWKFPVKMATAAALPAYTRVGNVITANANGAMPTVDGIAPVVSDRVLLKDGAAGADNGIYTVTSLGSAGTPWVITRAVDMDTSADIGTNTASLVNQGTTQGGFIYRVTTLGVITLNTTSTAWSASLQGPTPTADADLANKGYVDAAKNGLTWKKPVRVATSSALPAYTRVGNVITANANGALPAIDGVALVVGDRILQKDAGAGADNGIYSVTSLGSGGTPWVMTRATDADSSAELPSGSTVEATEGNSQTGFIFRLSTPDPIALNTTSLTFSGELQTASPNTDQSAATKAYVDAIQWKNPVLAATAAALPAYTRVGNVITANANGALPVVDGVTLGVGNRLLLKDGAAGADNGIYTVTSLGSAGTPWVITRSFDADLNAEVLQGMTMVITQGATQGGFVAKLTTANPITLNATALTFSLSPKGPTPGTPTDLANKQYVDDADQQLQWKNPVVVATAAALPAYTRVGNILTANANGALPTVDGVALIVGNRLLLKDGAAGADNGIYTVTDVGSGGTPWVMTRAVDMDSSAKTLTGAATYVQSGTANANFIFQLRAAGTIVLNTTGLNFRARAQNLTTVTLAAGAEAGNAIPVTIALVDLAGIAFGRVQRLYCQVFDNSGLLALAAAFTLAETGAGTEVTATGNPTLVIDTDVNGAAIVTITDVSGIFAGDMWLKVTPMASGVVPLNPGFPQLIKVTFA